MNFIKIPERLKNFFSQSSGGKKRWHLKRISWACGILMMLLAAVLAYFSPADDQTFYRHSTKPEISQNSGKTPKTDLGQSAQLFERGQRNFERAKELETEAKAKNHRIALKYFAPQLVGAKFSNRKNVDSAMSEGSQLLGFLVRDIDSREPAVVKVKLPYGGELNGVEIEKNSILSGRMGLKEDSEKVQLDFFRITSPDGASQKISASAYDASDYRLGLKGEFHSDKGIKVASRIGLRMFGSITDVLTERESFGFMNSGQTAKPTMRNALLQGGSRAAEDEANDAENGLQSRQSYVILRKNTPVVIQLTEDYKNHE